MSYIIANQSIIFQTYVMSQYATYKYYFTIIGRLNEPLESLFYYDVANEHDFEYYNSLQGYTPLFDIQATATTEQQEEAHQVCTIDGRLNDACVYDYYATGNAEASSVAAVAFSNYSTSQEILGLFVTVCIHPSVRLFH